MLHLDVCSHQLFNDVSAGCSAGLFYGFIMPQVNLLRRSNYMEQNSIREITLEEAAQVTGGLAVGAGVDVLGLPALDAEVQTSPILTPVLSLVGSTLGGVLSKA